MSIVQNDRVSAEPPREEPADHNKFHNESKNKRVKAHFYVASAIKVIVPRFVYAQQLKEAQLECANRAAESSFVCGVRRGARLLFVWCFDVLFSVLPKLPYYLK